MGIVVELAAPVTLDTVAPHDEGALRDWFAVLAAAQAHDVPADPPPCWVEHHARLEAGEPGDAETAWPARAGTEPVGVALLALPLLDNPDNALGELVVAPAHRGRGIGRRLLHRLADAARAAGRHRLRARPVDGEHPGGPARRHGGAEGTHVHRSPARRPALRPRAARRRPDPGPRRSINEAMGYCPYDRLGEWELDL
ncbi:GNAT family N-acetyltransferase [Pseudonocardia adelaidensis]|uniref:GNAT family N-acetyltransferase n=1 Tax=Pseudonocardia adelaidensis TaxID=648754 RepID=UPI0031E9C22B